MTIQGRITRMALGGLAAALAGVATPARAVCDSDGNATTGVCYKLRGSDTLFDIMTTSIAQARLDGGGASPLALAAKDLFYQGTGSGNAEGAMRTALATPAPNGSLGSQSIGPMSRNFRPSVIDALSTTFVARDAGHLTATGHAAWYPNNVNVVGLDAAVFVVKGTSALENITFSTFTNNAVPEAAYDQAVTNNTALPTVLNNPGAFNKLSPTINYSNLMSIILSGYDGSGTLAACSDPRRVQAVQDMAQFLGVQTINHVLRRDENSGTTDTFKDRIMVVAATSDTTRYPWTGGRFCNGAALGGINGATNQQGLCSTSRAACTSDANCTLAEHCWFNLNNPDYDPIRRPCMAGDANTAPTSCTDMTTGLPCQASDGNANCTQGLVVGLSDADIGFTSVTDITTTIGYRVGQGGGDVIGYAGREAGSTTFSTKALAINTHRATDVKVRNSQYLLARRLFIQNSVINSVSVFDIPTDTAGGGGANGGSDQLNKEQLLWASFLSDRSKMDPIVRQFNFIRCSSTADGGDPTSEANNLCALDPPPAPPAAFGNYQPVGVLNNIAGPPAINVGGAWSIKYDGTVPPKVTTGTVTSGWSMGRTCTAGSPCTCSTTTPCVSGAAVAFGSGAGQPTIASGNVCVSGTATTTACPLPVYSGAGGKKPTGSPCSVAAECVSNACIDLLGTAVPGELHDLYCQ